MSKQSGGHHGEGASNLKPKFPKIKPWRGKPVTTTPQPVVPTSPEKSESGRSTPRPKIPIWIDGQGEVEVELPKGVPFDYKGFVVDLKPLNSSIGGIAEKIQATLVVGNFAGQVGIGSATARTSVDAIKKSLTMATKSAFTVALNKTTIASPIDWTSEGRQATILPGKPGSGIIAPRSVQELMKLAGITDATVSLPEELSDLIAVMETATALRKHTKPVHSATEKRARRHLKDTHRNDTQKKYVIAKRESVKKKRVKKTATKRRRRVHK